MTFADGCCKGSFERDLGGGDGVDGFVRYHGFAVFEGGGDVDGVPFYWGFGGGEDVLDGLGDLGAGVMVGVN